MKKLILYYSITAIAFFLHSAAYSQKKEKDKLLAGKVFEAEFTEQKKKAKPIKDEINFKSEKISVKFISEKTGFTDNHYTASIDSSSGSMVISFESEGKNKDNEVIKWKGSVTKEIIGGTATITDKKGKTKTEYFFSGNLKSPKKK